MSWWGKKVARLPDRGTLLVATDLQGNLRDYRRLRAIYDEEERAGNRPLLALVGDLVHGPGDDLSDPEDWPEHLGTFYEDRSAELILDYMRFAETANTVALLGNHEHAHCGGPVVSKFHDDEAAVLDRALGNERDRVRRFLKRMPLVAVAPCGAVLTHAAPRDTEPDLESFEKLSYAGFEDVHVSDMYRAGTVGALTWARGATDAQAHALLRATGTDGRSNAFVAHGHDVVPEGYDKVGDAQICVSTSFGLEDARKVYLRLDLSTRYRDVHDLSEGDEILPLYRPC